MLPSVLPSQVWLWRYTGNQVQFPLGRGGNDWRRRSVTRSVIYQSPAESHALAWNKVAETHKNSRGGNGWRRSCAQSHGAGTGRSVLCVKTSLQRGGGGRARANQGRGLRRGANERGRIAPWRQPPERLKSMFFVSILDYCAVVNREDVGERLN